MSLFYADTSALLRAYFMDEPDHEELRALLLEGSEPVVTSELARIEVASATRAAARAGRFRRWRQLVLRFDADCQEDGPITLLRLRPERIMDTARRLVLEHRLRTLDAIHLAVAVEECPPIAGDDEVVLVTRDAQQGEASRAVGLLVR